MTQGPTLYTVLRCDGCEHLKLHEATLLPIGWYCEKSEQFLDRTFGVATDTPEWCPYLVEKEKCCD